jgi:hypothetical protein
MRLSAMFLYVDHDEKQHSIERSMFGRILKALKHDSPSPAPYTRAACFTLRSLGMSLATPLTSCTDIFPFIKSCFGGLDLKCFFRRYLEHVRGYYFEDMRKRSNNLEFTNVMTCINICINPELLIRFET